MNNEQINDLKDFFRTELAQTNKRIVGLEVRTSKELAKIRLEIADLRSENIDGFAGVADAIEGLHHQVDERDAKVEARFARLERQLIG